VPPVQEPGRHEAGVLERVDRGMLERGVVEGRDVPAPHHGDVEHDGDGGMGERAGGALQTLQAAGGRAEDHLGQAHDEQDRRHVEEQDVLDHVHREGLLAEAIDGGDERGEEREDRAGEGQQASDRRAAGTRARADAAPARDVGRRRQADERESAGVERPRSVRSHCARLSQSRVEP
jgi:hypothetical protein